jgi:hypothetical protein
MPALAERVGRLQAFLAQVMNYFLTFQLNYGAINQFIPEGKRF